jgi:hypothetical protein
VANPAEIGARLSAVFTICRPRNTPKTERQ